MEIKFTNITPVSDLYKPKPASEFLPDWYKELSSYTSESGKKETNGNGSTTGTAKKCMPLFDAIVSGYIITTPADIYVSQKNGEPYYEWASLELIQFHPVEQAPNHPNRNNHNSYPKWVNPWSIETPNGYSTLFIQPLHRESLFTIFPGVVDTDKYKSPVNFPFVLNDVKFEGLIPAGTPIAQVIPFKRDSWEMSIGNNDNLDNHLKTLLALKSKIFDGYKSLFRQPKEYK